MPQKSSSLNPLLNSKIISEFLDISYVEKKKQQEQKSQNCSSS